MNEFLLPVKRTFLVIGTLFMLISPERVYALDGFDYVHITADNVERLSERPLLAFIYTDCGLGINATRTFLYAFEDANIRLGLIEYNSQAHSVFRNLNSNKPYDLGTLALIHRRQVLATSNEQYPEPYLPHIAYNLMRHWLKDVAFEHGLDLGLGHLPDDRMTPDRGGSVNLDHGLAAYYTFESESTGSAGYFTFYPDDSGLERTRLEAGVGTSVSGGYLHSNGQYSTSTNARIIVSSYSEPDRLTLDEGITFAVRFQTREEGFRFMTLGYREFDIGLRDGKLMLSPDAYFEDRGIQWSQLTLIEGMELNQWIDLIVSIDPDQNRIRVHLNGRRLDDIYLYDDFVESYQTSNADFQFYNRGNGDVLNGRVDHLVIYDRALNANELEALHRRLVSDRGADPDSPVAGPDEPELPPGFLSPEEQRRVNMEFVTAANAGNLRATSVALNEGAQINFKYDGWTALMLASYKGHNRIVRLLIERNANPLFKISGWTAQDLASYQGHDNIASLLDDHSNSAAFYNQRTMGSFRTRMMLEPPL